MKPLSSTSSSGRRAPSASSQSGSAERRPPQSMTRSARSSSPSVVRTPVTWGTPPMASAPPSSPATVTPRRTSSPGVSSATEATARSTTGPAAGEHGVTGVAGARPAGHRVRGVLHRIHAHCAVALDGGGDVRQFRFEGLAVTREEQMGQPHLVDTLALPAVPGFLGILGGRLRVPLDNGDQVVVAGEHHPQTQAHHPATDHHDLGHSHTPRCSCYRCVYSTVTLLARLRG